MACVNVNDKGFKATSKRLNIDPRILEGIIDGYWVANPNLELNQEYPSDQYILNYLRLGGVSSTQFSSLLEYENAHTLWKQKYSNIKNFDNSNDARDYNYLVERLFGKANVGVIPRLNKTFDVVVLEPQKNIPSEPIVTKPETTESTEVKEGVEELFESNSKLANEVYEALGFGKDSNYYEGDIKPEPNTVFVFGSNPEGRHGAGAAKVAREQFGAIYGQGEGLQGNAYALPTKNIRKVTTPKGTINVYWGQAESETSTKILSNLAPRKFTWEGREYGSVEHAYQSNKSGTFDKVTYDAYNNIGGYGRKIRGKGTIAEMKAADSLGLMKKLVVESFRQNPNSEATTKLLQYKNFTHNTNELIDKAFLEGLQLAQKELNTTGLKSISPKQIIDSIIKLYDIAEQNPDKQFKVAYRNTTDTSLNGYTGLEMIEMFNQAGTIPSNVIFSKEWVDTNKLNIKRQITLQQKEEGFGQEGNLSEKEKLQKLANLNKDKPVSVKYHKYKMPFNAIITGEIEEVSSPTKLQYDDGRVEYKDDGVYRLQIKSSTGKLLTADVSEITGLSELINSEITPQEKQQAQQQYSQYLDTIFPDSKVKDIVYHLTTKQFESFSLDAEKSLTKESIGRWGKGVSFAGTTELTESLFKDDDGNLLPNLRKISAIVNVVNPLTDIPLNGREAVYDAQLKGEYDSVVSGLGDNGTVNKYTELTIGTPEQIHILGSKQDIKGFKEFIAKQEDSLVSDVVDSLNQQIETSSEDTLSDREKKIIKDRDAFLNSDIISPTEREYLAKLTVSMFSTILDQLLGLNDNAEYNAESFKELYFPGKYGDSDFRIMSRGAIIKQIQPMTIFNVIKEQFFNPYKRDELSDEAFDILELCYLNFETLLDCGYHKLVTNERIPLLGNYNGEVNDLDNVDDDNESEDPEIPKSTTEKYNIRARSVSVRDSLSPLIRRALDRIQEKDDAGQVVLDQYGLPKLIDTDTVYNTILSSVRKATTIELMESILENIATINPWITGVLDLIKKEPFRSQFYLNFRKDFTKYSIVKRELDKDGNYIFITHIINTNDLSKSIISDIRNLLVSDELPIVYNVDHLSGYGVVNMDIVKASKARLKTVMDKFKVTNEQFSIQDLQNLSNTHYAEVSNILQVIGISLNDVVIKNILAGSTSKAKLFSRESSVGFKVLNAIDSILSAIENTENPERYALLGEDKNSVKGFYRDIAKTISDYTELSVESSTYENGKLYYSYTTPSYLGKLILNLKNSMNNIDEFNEFISENYTQYGWFVHDTLLKDGSIKKEHSNEWLRLLSENTQNGAKMRNMLEHKVQLHYNNVNYIDLSALDYSVALILEFFSDFASKPTYAWYHVPIIADKPSAEYIKFRRYTNNNNTSVDGYEKEIVRQLVKVAKQELRRIKTVRERATLDVEKITNFDTRGSEFQFLDFLNDIFLKGDNRESALVQEYLNDNIENTDELTKLLEKHIQTGMENKFKAALTTWEKIGVLDTHKNPKTDLTVYTYLNNVGTNREEVEEALKNYFYNSFFATTEIIQLTVTDIAYSKDTEDFQKRFAQTHSPALRLNTSAVDSNGERYTKDGKERTMYLADELLTSELVPMVEKIFEDKIKSAKNAAQKKGYTALRDNVINAFTHSKNSDGINVTDAQAYTTLKGYRKKMGQAGKWTEAMQAAYERINSGNMNIQDLEIVCQPMKPFVYTQIAKQSYSKVMKFLKVPVQNKNSEYVLIMAGAIAASQGGKVNRLKAISEFMDANDIDTIQFGTAVKSGQMGVIDINVATSEKDIKTILEAHTFAIDPTTSAVKTDAGQKIYNEQYVHEIPFEDYGIQQEVPEHLVDAYQLFGSQIRKLILADITPGTIFQVGQDGESMTREQLIDLYQELIAANVEESFNKLVKDLKLDNADIKVKNKAISKLLAEEIRTNSRYGPDLLIACSLNEEGDFVIPLADPSQSYRIQQLMNSIIKSRITKQKIKGGAVVLVSPYGLSNDLNIIFNEDGSVKYFECYMPAYSKEFFKDFLDEKGQLNVEQLPDELRKLIGYRIPTEDKYSMAPLYIKDFLAAESGSAIMLPKEITLLSGSDYDIDKMYVMLPEFKVSRHVNANKFKKAFKETLQTKVSYDDLDIAYNLVVIREGVDGISENTLEDKMNKFYLENKSKFTDVKYEKVKYNPNQSAISQSVEARNNRIIDLMYSILTNKDTADKIFNPGSFDVLKKTSRIIIILKNSKQYTYEDLKDLSLDELKAIVKKHGFVNTRSILDPTTQVAFHQQNTTAGKLIGVFANHNSSHAIMQLQDARFNMQKEIVFDGTSFKDIRSSTTDVLGAKLDNVYALDGFTYISKNNAGYLAASVDAVKDPVLNHMNLNTYTANVAMVLSRMGYDSDSIGLFLTLPAIERVTQLYFKLSNEGYISSDNPVNAEIAVITEKLGGLISEEAISENLAMSNFTKAELANHLNAEETSEELLYQLETLVLFKELLKMGSSLNELTFLTKYDTVSNAVGPTIADSLAKLLRVSKFLKGADKEKAPFTPGTYAVFEKSPMLNAFYVYSNQASRLIFQDNFPHFLADFVKALEILRDSTKSDINVLTVNRFINDFIAFKLTKEIPDGTVFKSGRADRQRFLLTDYKDDNEKTRQGFIGWFTLQVADNPTLALNPLIRVLTVKEKSKHNPIRSLVANVTGLSSDAIETVKNGWSNLVRNPETKELALALFNYNFYKSGFSFSPTSFMHLAPNDVKIAATAYISSLRPNTTNSIFEIDAHKTEAFVNLFKRNNGHDKRLVPSVDSTQIKYSLLEAEDETLIAFDTLANAELDKIIVSDYDSRVYSDIITITQLDKNKNVVESMYMNVSENNGAPIYLKISPLGIKNGALEYSYETSHVDYSVIPDNLKPKLVTGNPDNISGMDVQTMEKVYKEHSGIIEKITATVSNMSTEDIQKILGNTHHQLSKVIKVLRKAYPEFEKTFDSATKSKLIKYLTNALLKDASGVKIC